MKTIITYKKRGQTPLEAIAVLKEERADLKNKKVSFAGRLDPMAEGLLLLLVGEENKKRKLYEDFTKEYHFSILFGVATDTYDVLGKITESKETYPELENLKKILPSFTGEQIQEYPPFSSKTIDGKPMYYLARNKLLANKKIPTIKVRVSNLLITGTKTISRQELVEKILADIKKVKGDFRQEEIISEWKRWNDSSTQGDLTLVDLKADVSKGTYIRTLAHLIGKELSTPSLAYSIIRTRIGNHTLPDL